MSYGLSREALEELNFVIKSSDSIVYTNDNVSSDVKCLLHMVLLTFLPPLQFSRSLSYQFNLFAGIPRPTILLREPLLVEIFGAGFTKAPHNKVRRYCFCPPAGLTCIVDSFMNFVSPDSLKCIARASVPGQTV